MCHAKRCRRCGKVTWAGCGQHVDQVLRNVPRAERCTGHENEPREPGRLMAMGSARPIVSQANGLANAGPGR